ncbi:hypothetical protein FQR65_LT13438 [Abscondita terminalis]|nr:hypothetical protein FQR65_LT13438 [Abscondita terminalis]
MLKYTLFEDHEDILQLFERFKELKTKEDQSNSLELQEHAGTVMNTLDEGIRTLDNIDAFNDYLHQVGAMHRKIPGFKVEYFWVSTKLCFSTPVLEYYNFGLILNYEINIFYRTMREYSQSCYGMSISWLLKYPLGYEDESVKNKCSY